MNTRLVFEVLREKGGAFDHESFWLEKPKGIVVMSIDVDEYESHSGSHKVTTNLCPDLIDRYCDYYVAEPIARVYIDWGVVKLFEYEELPSDLSILKKVHGMPGKLWDYDLSPLISVINKARLGYFAWWVNGATRCQDLLVVRAPRSEREGAEWLAKWLERKIPEYLAEKIKS